ncbi:MAG: hypothetical protein QW589_04010 [Candidatus Bathyarchaeia archaeon]
MGNESFKLGEIKFKPKETFNKILIEAIDDGLLSLGLSVRHAIYWHLEKKTLIKKAEIPYRLEVFLKGLHSIFGPGASIIEMLIVKKLYEKLGLSFIETHDYGFMDYVKKAKEDYEKSEKIAL